MKNNLITITVFFSFLMLTSCSKKQEDVKKETTVEDLYDTANEMMINLSGEINYVNLEMSEIEKIGRLMKRTSDDSLLAYLALEMNQKTLDVLDYREYKHWFLRLDDIQDTLFILNNINHDKYDLSELWSRKKGLRESVSAVTLKLIDVSSQTRDRVKSLKNEAVTMQALFESAKR